MKLFNFQYLQEQVKKKLKQNKIQELKKLLMTAYKFKYLKTNPALIDGRKKQGIEAFKILAEEFLNPLLVLKATIKERGWSDSMIEEYLIPDIYKPNRYYKCAGDIKLYSLTRVELLEQDDPINKLIEKNLTKRYVRKVKKETDLLLKGIKFVQSIGSYNIAIGLLFQALQKQEKETNFDNIHLTNEVLNIIKPFITHCFIAEEIFTNLYVYWVNIQGFKFCFLSADPSWFPVVNGNLVKYDFDYISSSTKLELNLIYNLSGWGKIEDISQGINILSKNTIPLSQPNWEQINQFPTSEYPNPPHPDAIFIVNLAKEKLSMWKSFSEKLQNINCYQKIGCPLELNCNIMGKNSNYCSNFLECKKNVNRTRHSSS